MKLVNDRHVKIVIDHLPDIEDKNFHNSPTVITLINMENEKDMESTEVMGLYDAMDKARELHKKYNSIFDIERYDENGEFLGKVNL